MGYDLRIIGLHENFATCVFVKGCCFHLGDEDALASFPYEFKDGFFKCFLDEDEGNTEYMVSVFNPTGAVFKGKSELDEFLKLEYCHRFEGKYKFEYDSGISMFTTDFDAESG